MCERFSGLQRARPVTIWSAGCATGEEPYSLAIGALETGAAPRILATDINPTALATAARGLFSERSLRCVDARRRQRFFSRAGSSWELAPEVRALVSFARHDLTGSALPAELVPRAGFDVIFCRNVFIYFGRQASEAAARVLSERLAPDGFLVLGASEWLQVGWDGAALRRLDLEIAGLDGTLVYRRRAGPADPSVRLTAPASPPRRGAGNASAPSSNGAPPLAERSAGERVRPNVAPPARLGPSLSASSAVGHLAGDEFINAGDPAAALRAYEVELVTKPLAASLHLRIGLCRLRLGHDLEAHDALRRALFLDGDCWPASFLLGDIVEAEDPVAAARYFRQAYGVLASPGEAGQQLEEDSFLLELSRDLAREAALLRLTQLEARTEKEAVPARSKPR